MQASLKRPRDSGKGGESGASGESGERGREAHVDVDAQNDPLRTLRTLEERCGTDAPEGPWRAAAAVAGVVGPDAFLCHLGRAVHDAHRSLGGQAEAAYAEIRHSRARLLCAVNDRFDALNALVAEAAATKSAALEHELCAVDAALEKVRRARGATTVFLEAAHKDTAAGLGTERISERTSELAALLDASDAELLALPTAVVELPLICAEVKDAAAQWAKDTENLGCVVAPRSARAILAHMRVHLDDAAIAAQACDDLANRDVFAAAVAASASSILDIGVGVVAALRTHVSNALVAAMGCSALSLIAESVTHSSIDDVLRVGAVDALVAALRTHMGDPVVAEQACCALCNITEVGPQFVAEGAAVLVAALRAHAQDAGIVEMACIAIENIARAPAGLGLQAVVDAGAANAIVAVLRTHLDKAPVAEAICRALVGVIRDSHAGALAAGEAGGPAVVVAVLQAHVRNATLAELGCAALMHFAQHPAGPYTVVQARGVDAIVGVLRAHDTADVVAASLSAFSRILDDPHSERAALDARALEAIVATLRAHVSHAKIAAWGVTILGDFALLSIEGTQAAVAEGAIDVVVALMRAHAADKLVSEWGCQAICNLTTAATGQQAAVNAAAAGAVVAAVRAHTAIAGVVEQGCAALANISINEAGDQALAAAGASDAVIAALQAHPRNTRIIEAACMALTNMAASEGGAAAAAAAGAGARV